MKSCQASLRLCSLLCSFDLCFYTHRPKGYTSSLSGVLYPGPVYPGPRGTLLPLNPRGYIAPRFGVHCPSRDLPTEIGVRFALDSGYTAPPEPSDRNRGTFCNQIGIRFQEPAYPKNRHTFGTQIAVYSFWRARSARGIPRVKSAHTPLLVLSRNFLGYTQ